MTTLPTPYPGPVLLAAGHSDSDPGAVYFGRTEASIVTAFRDAVAGYLREGMGGPSSPVVTDGPVGNNWTLTRSIDLARSCSPAIEFHCNAFTSAAATGVETLSLDRHKPLGASLCDVIATTLGIANRGAKGESAGQHSRLGFVQAGGIIVELFFLSNPNDLQRFDERADDLAQVVALAIERFIEP